MACWAWHSRHRPAGQSLDGKGDIGSTERRLLETQAPSVVERQPVVEPLQTGIKAIDSMTPIGRGQRQLIIGDRQTGKTAICMSTRSSTRTSRGTEKAVKCIYVAIGQKNSTVAEVVRPLEEGRGDGVHGGCPPMPRTLRLLQMYAAYAGSAIGQHWMYKGEHALDHLRRPVQAGRCLPRDLAAAAPPPGREAYPGDVFYLHSRLLERCRQAFRRARRRVADRSADHRDQGQRRLGVHPDQRDFDHRWSDLPGDRPVLLGIRPAMNAGESVSRVGGAAQIKAMKKIAGPLRLNLAQFRELEAFAEFGSELDAVSLAQLERVAGSSRCSSSPSSILSRSRAGGGDLRGHRRVLHGRHCDRRDQFED